MGRIPPVRPSARAGSSFPSCKRCRPGPEPTALAPLLRRCSPRVRRGHGVGRAMSLVGAPGLAAPAVAVASESTRVSFRTLDDVLLEWYLAGEEWRERAGAYAIQGRGAALVRRIDGDYLNVVGLPAAALLDLWPGLLGGST